MTIMTANMKTYLPPTIMTTLEYDLFGDLPAFSSTSSGSDNSCPLPVTTVTPPLASPPETTVVTPPLVTTVVTPPPVPVVIEDRKKERVIKNRQSAQASRERKRQYVAELEQTRDSLMEESRNLRTRVGSLEREKSTLVCELTVLKREFDELKRLVLGDKTLDTGTESNSNQRVHCDNGMMGQNVGKSIHYESHHHGLKGPTGLSAQCRVWRDSVNDGTIGNVHQQQLDRSSSVHTPSASFGHLLVQSGEASVLPGQQPLNHVLRLRLRYRRASPVTTTTEPQRQPTNITTSSTNRRSLRMERARKMSRIYGSARGKNSLLLSRRTPQRVRRMKRTGVIPSINRQHLSMLWNQIISKKKSTKKSRK